MTNYANIRYQPAAASTTTVADMAALIALTGMSNGDQALVQATNKLYMYSGTGWYLIATIQNDAPSAITGVNGSYSLESDGTATTITAVSTDPEGFPLTWSYSTSGLGSIATISNIDNVFTITPSTTEADAGTFTITINATDGVNGAVSTSTNLTLNFIITVTDSKYTTLLATAVDTSDNNNITDESTNNHTITVNGDAHAGTFSPYRSGGYSTYFDGTTNTYLNVSSSSGGVAIGSGDFTISFWLYCNDEFTREHYLLDYRPLGVGSGNHPIIYLHPDATFRYKLAGTDVIIGNTAISSKQWAYFCLARDNGTTKMYVNGTLQTDTHSGTESLTNGTNRPVIGTGAYAIMPMFDGYISDLRVVTSLDTTAYSVPSERLEAVTNTSLLTCHLPYIADGSTNDHSITVNGNTSTEPFSPYDYTEYSATDHGGSVYFDGTTDYIEHQGGFTLPAGTNANWTIECWVNLDQVNLNQGILRVSSTAANGNNDDIYFSEQGGYINTACKGGAIASTTTNYKMYANTWHHIAMVKNSGTVYLYNNGVYCGSVSDSNDYSGNYYVYGGLYYSSSYCIAGYLSDFKISNSAIYTTGTSNFTPPTAPLSSSGTSLHIKGIDASIIDKSQGFNLKLEGNITGSTTQVKFSNTKSMSFDSVDDLINLNGVLDLSQACTWEAWVYFDNHPDASGFMHMFQSASYSSTDPPFGIRFKTTGSRKINFVLYTTSGNHEVQSPNPVSLDTWYHLAFSRTSSGVYNVYIDGTRYSTFTESATYQSAGDVMVIGNSGTGSTAARYLDGYMQDIRITQGLARYTAADETSNIPSAPLEG